MRARVKPTHSRKAMRKDVNPLASVANLVDIMLVFACGLMVAIVTYWNVDLENLDALIESDTYVEAGQVYEDPETHQIFVIVTSEDEE